MHAWRGAQVLLSVPRRTSQPPPVVPPLVVQQEALWRRQALVSALGYESDCCTPVAVGPYTGLKASSSPSSDTARSGRIAGAMSFSKRSVFCPCRPRSDVLLKAFCLLSVQAKEREDRASRRRALRQSRSRRAQAAAAADARVAAAAAATPGASGGAAASPEPRAPLSSVPSRLQAGAAAAARQLHTPRARPFPALSCPAAAVTAHLTHAGRRSFLLRSHPVGPRPFLLLLLLLLLALTFFVSLMRGLVPRSSA